MAGFIPPDKLEQIRNASDIVDVIGAALPLKRAGANFTALCPFHKEKSPSFNVNPHKQIFHCFGCHKGGDVFTFIREYENLSFVEAVKRLADRASIPLEFENQPGQQQTRHVKESLLQMHEQIAQRWQTALANDANGQIARDYLAKRGVSDEAVKLFRLGYAPDAWDDTVNWAKSKGYELPLVEQGGLIIRKEDSDRFYDRFRGRLMFPICDEQGRIIGFSGRVLSGDEKTAKYVNSPETPIFSKGKVFFGLDKSKRAILDAGFAIICEGQLDLIACHTAGVKNIVAPQGTAFTPEHARILKRYVDEVVLCFDSDSAGQNAAVRVLDSLLVSGLAIRVATVPAPHDPDSFIKAEGGQAFQQVINKAEGFFDFYLDRLCATNDVRTDKGRLAVIKGMVESLEKVGSSTLLDVYAQKTAQKLGVAHDALRQEFRVVGVSNKRRNSNEQDEELSVEVNDDPAPDEMHLLMLILTTDHLVEWVRTNLRVKWITDPVVRKLVNRFFELHATNAWKGAAAFLADFQDDPDARRLITLAIASVNEFSKSVLSEPEKYAANVLTTMRDQWADYHLTDLRTKLENPDISDTEKVEIVRKLDLLRGLKRNAIVWSN